MKEVSLAVSSRTTIGKGPARRSRREGRIPAVVYGPEVEPVSVEVTEQALRAAMKEAAGMSAIFNLEVNGKTRKVIVRDVQRDPLTSHIVHIDFHAISMTKPLHLSVPIHITGIARGVKTDGGILQTTMRELEISCLPSDIPEHVVVDVSDLGIGDSVHVRDLNVPNAKILTELQRTVVVVAAPTIVKLEPTAEELAAAQAAAEGAEAAAEGAEAAEGESKTEEKGKEKKE
ncbi:MAG: 50S ribosomal protein L25/general stress protein Ctc [Candidatus Zixiibacteriota bacterium]